MDARPKVNAVANTVNGGGFETIGHYSQCSLKFLGIGNIHVLRDAWDKLRSVCRRSVCTHSSLSQSGEYERGHESRCQVHNMTFLSDIEGTGWFEQMFFLITAASDVVRTMTVERKSVLVHCSDGWDRTAQVVALAQVLMDPYYRTMEGFCVLVDKEWVHAGHKFGDRHGYLLSSGRASGVGELPKEINSTASRERSPVFLLFLDCVFQFTVQFPSAFEFRSSFLATIARQSYSGRHGTFSGCSMLERNRLNLASRSSSLWQELLPEQCPHVGPGGAGAARRSNRAFANPFFSYGANREVLTPDPAPRSLVLWTELFMAPLSSSSVSGEALYGREAAVESALAMRSRIEQLERQLADQARADDAA
jgi:Myotubularin-like phosphatase domain